MEMYDMLYYLKSEVWQGVSMCYRRPILSVLTLTSSLPTSFSIAKTICYLFICIYSLGNARSSCQFE